jgi:glycosyltransferase involved in cell wall biosynthesis
MKLSILIITYNHENYVNECLDSILFQDMQFDYEIIVADDFSTDSTLQLIEKKLLNSESKYQILSSSQNIGIEKNYQRGFKACQGEYVAVLEGDDYWTDPKRLKKHITFLDSHRECVLSFNSIIQYHEETSRFIVPQWNYADDFKYITAAEMALGNCIGNLSACVFRNSAIQKLKPDLFDLQVADWMLGMALGQFGLLAHLKEAMSVYRLHSEGIWTSMKASEKKNSLLLAIENYNKYLDFKYDKEFKEHKKRILHDSNPAGNVLTIKDFVPPVFLMIIKIIIPLPFRRFLKRIIGYK